MRVSKNHFSVENAIHFWNNRLFEILDLFANLKLKDVQQDILSNVLSCVMFSLTMKKRILYFLRKVLDTI